MGAKSSKRGTGDVVVDPKEKARSAEIDRALHGMIREEEKVIKLLLLGAGESGKSTCFRQMVRLYSDGFTSDELMTYAPIVRNNVVVAMGDLVAICDRLAAGDTDEAKEFSLEAHGLRAEGDAVLEAVEDQVLTEAAAEAIRRLYPSAPIQQAFVRRAEFQVPDSAMYFFQRIDELADPDYLPTEDHMIRCRVRTTGIVERQFSVENSVFSIVDVGGQRNERRKWIHCFDGVTAVIFVAAASEYDQVLFEDSSVNRLDEALRLFSEITDLPTFKDTPFILFLNKSDLFDEKIHTSPLSKWDPTFTGDDDSFEQTMRHIATRFFDANRSSKRPFLHVTCATDHTSVDTVFRAVKRIVVSEHLKSSGLVS